MLKQLTLCALLLAVCCPLFSQPLSSSGDDSSSVLVAAPLSAFPAEVPAVASYTSSAAAAAGVSAPRKSKENGVYYTKPAGSLYDVTTDFSTGGISIFSYLSVPAWDAFTFTNQSEHPTDCSWYLYGAGYHADPTPTNDYTSSADASGSLSLTLTPGYMYGGGPFLSYEDILFSFGGSNEYWPPCVMCYDECYWLAFGDNKTMSSSGTLLDSGYPIGTGTCTMVWGEDAAGNKNFYDGVFYCSGTAQRYPAPASPLYVEEMYLEVVANSSTYNGDPLQNGATLTIVISDTDTDDVLYTLTATTGDFTSWYNRGNYYVGGLTFHHKVADAEFGEIDAPFVLDRACTFTLSGLEDTDNINIGIRLAQLDDCDEEEEYADGVIPLFVDKTGTITPLPTYTYNNYMLGARFYGMMDKVSVYDNLSWSGGRSYEGYASLTIDAGGTTCKNDITAASSYNLGGLYAQTVRPWYDDNGNDNYTFTPSLPDWITAVTVDTSNYKVSNRSYYNVVSFTAEKNESADARTWTGYMQGLGYTDSQLITITQSGDPSAAGLSASSSSSSSVAGATYNVAGQRVSDNAAGVVVRGGKKILNK